MTRPPTSFAPETLTDLVEALPELSERVVASVIDEVPSYADALSGAMGENIQEAVRLALGGFITMAGRSDAGHPQEAVLDGAYRLGRGEARSGRSADALLSAYRIGARVSWEALSERIVAAGMEAAHVSAFATLVFAYIDELSAASVAGHTDESATSGRVRERLLERLGRRLLEGVSQEAALAAAEAASWEPPETLTAVIVPESRARSVVGTLRGDAVVVPLEDVDDGVILLVPDHHGHGRAALLRTIGVRGAVAGPARPWWRVGSSYARARRAFDLGLGPDSDEHLAALVLSAAPEALADLRARVLEPLAELRPATREKLEETLRAWLLHHGRRDEVAAALFVHPQTVRYRMGQLREVYGERLEDPATVLELTLALALPPKPGAEQR